MKIDVLISNFANKKPDGISDIIFTHCVNFNTFKLYKSHCYDLWQFVLKMFSKVLNARTPNINQWKYKYSSY